MIRYEAGFHRRDLIGQLLLVGLWLGVTVVALALRPSPAGYGTHQQLGLPACPSHMLFGRPCPSCGMTTSVTALLHGDLPAALRANPFGPPFYLLLTAMAAGAFVGYLRGARFNTNTRSFNIAALGFLGIFVAYGIYRFFTPG